MKFLRIVVVLSLISLLASACVTRKKKGEVSGIKKFYHNTTSYYNGYFNANELVHETVLAMEQSYKDNYSRVLPVFPYNALPTVESHKPNLDKAIEKLSVDLTLHKVARWADDCYLLLSKAQYYKKDYETAENSYRFLLETYNPYKNKTSLKKIKAKTAKQKKEEAADRKKELKEKAEAKAKAREKAKKEALKQKKKAAKDRKKGIKTSKSTVPTEKNTKTIVEDKIETPKPVKAKSNKEITNEGNWLVKHTPAYWEALIWSGKNLIERGKYYEAERLFQDAEKDPLTPTKLKSELYASKADLYIKSKKDEMAIQALQQAISVTKKKKKKARYAYIVGQLYQKQKNFAASQEAFNQCLHFKPDYYMEFHALLSKSVNESELGGSQTDIASQLQKMLKESKNEEFFSEIYHYLALISLKNNQTADAIKYLNQSLQSPQITNDLKAENYYLLANHFFDQENFVQAKYYYDSTLSFIPKNDERRKDVSLLVANLSEIAKNTEVIVLQDSLIRMSQLPVKEKRALAIQMKNANKPKLAEIPGPPGKKFPRLGNRVDDIGAWAESGLNNINEQNEKNNSGSGKQSTFFAYDIRATNRGRSEFQQSWGNRLQEDNWRRSNKTSFNIAEEVKSGVETTENQDSLEADLAQILNALPDTPEELREANQKIDEAMYLLGLNYRDKIHAYQKSKDALTALLKRYPESVHKADALYILYLNCMDLNDAGCANSYADQIKREFPDTRYGKSLMDPEYSKSLSIRKDSIAEDYKMAFENYSNSNYALAYEQLQSLQSKMKGPHPLQAKIALLTALCIGSTQGKDVYINSLRDVVANYPSTPEETKAKEILRFLKGDKDAFVEVTNLTENSAKFTAEDNVLHFITIQLYNPSSKDEQNIKLSISDYNVKYHKSDNLKMSTVQLDIDDNNPVYLIRKFESKDAAMNYYRNVIKRELEYINGFTNYEIYVISQNNYREVLKSKSFKEYKPFFDKNYSIKKPE
ncbi:MAG TPA: hypothetical protein PKD32_09915 [Saprospiraceae bacterium]|nr:hypothetical protein [Saprospiraceae bacterium]